MSRSSPWADDSAQLGKMKIVIIDDEPVNVALLEEILVENEYTRFESVVDSKLALEVCKNFQPDLVLLGRRAQQRPGSRFPRRMQHCI